MLTHDQKEQLRALHDWQARWLAAGQYERPEDAEPVPGFAGDWSRATFAGGDKDLRCADFRGVGAIRDVSLAGADLRGARLDGVDLRGADFAGARMDGVVLREADLRDAKLGKAVGLSIEHLAGADLRSVELPEGFKDFTQLEGVGQASQYLQSVYRLLLLLCGFAALTVMSVRDENVALHDTQSATPLPLLQTDVAPQVFAYVVPGLVLLLYAYQVLYTESLWRLVSFLPAYFPDGEPLDRRAYPSTVNVFIRYSLLRIRNEKNDRLNFVLHWMVAYAVPPLTLGVIWLAGLKKHDWMLSLYHGLLLGLAVFFGVAILVLSGSMIRNEWRIKDVSLGGFLRGFPRCLLLVGVVALFAGVWACFPGVHEHVPDVVPLALVALVMALGTIDVISWVERRRYAEATSSLLLNCLALAVALYCVTLSVFAGRNYELKTITVGPEGGAASTFPPGSNPSPMLWSLAHSLLNPFLDFRNKIVSKRPDGWKGSGTAENDQIALCVGADLGRDDLRSMDAERAFLARANLRHADLRGAYLRFAYFREADLTDARLDGAYIRGANFRDVSLHRVDLSKVILSTDLKDPTPQIGPNFQGVRVNYKELDPKVIAMLASQKVNNIALIYFGIGKDDTAIHPDDPVLKALADAGLPRLTDDELTSQKVVRKVVFPPNLPMSGCDLSGFVLRGATLDTVDVSGSLCVGADLRDCSFKGADVSGTDFTGANLSGVDFTGANVAGAVFTHSTWFEATGLEAQADLIMATEGHPPVRGGTK